MHCLIHTTKCRHVCGCIFRSFHFSYTNITAPPLLRWFVVMHHVTRLLRARADTVRDGTELRATKQMKRGENPAHSAYCIYLYTEFVILMQYLCKVYTDLGLLILVLNALRHFKCFHYNGFLWE